ncbi:MAG: hypothetical protein AAB505_02590 [Patescibacteria group bacterium]
MVIVILVVFTTGAYIWEQSFVPSIDFDYPSLAWKTYSNPYYNIRYPYDWLLNSSKAIPANEYESSIVAFVKENHKFEVYIPSAYSPSICLFEGDSPYTIAGEASTVKIIGDYIEVKSSLNTFRRPVNSKPVDGRTNEQVFLICQKEKNTNFFTTSNIHFSVPINYNSNLVSQMDEILKTFEDK